MRPLSLGHEAFDSHMIDLEVLVFSLSFIFKVSVGPSSDGMDHVVGGDIVALLQRLTNLERRWWWQVGVSCVGALSCLALGK
jgi:hypothetical protein